MKKRILLVGSGLVILIALLVACGAPSEKPPTKQQTGAIFEVVSLDVKPSEILVGEEATVTAKIANLGKAQGTYTAILTVNGVEVDRKEMTIPPEGTQTVTFKLTKDAGGTYTIEIGGLSQNLVVKKMVAKDVELKYDDGIARDYASASPGGGYLIDFTTPTAPFALKKVRISGLIAGEPAAENFEVEIWDKDRKAIYNAKYPVTKFPVGRVAWVEVEIPNVEVSGKFYVHIYTGTGRMQGIHVGADDSVTNEHSTVTIRSGGSTLESTSWGYPGWLADKSKVNWMIRVVGTSMVPE